MRLRRRTEPNAGIRVLERSKEALEARPRHLDPAARARVGQVIGLSHVLGVQQRDVVRALIVRVLVEDDLLVVRGQVLEWTGDLASLDQRLVLPDVGEPAAILVQPQQAAGAGHVRRVPETAEIEDDLRQVETGLAGRLHRILGIRERQLAQIAIQVVLARAFGKQADHVDLFAGSNFETRKDDDAVRFKESA